MQDTTSKIFIFFIVFYGMQTIATLFSDIFPPIWDLGTVLGILILFFIIHRSYTFTSTVPLFIGIGLLFHIAGLYTVIPYNEFYTGNLYGLPQLNYHYDLIVHSLGTGILSIALCSMLYPSFKKGFRSKFLIFPLFIFLVLGVGAFIEIVEYVGFDVLGYGDSFLEFGPGDTSPNSGPWQNASLDLMANIVGGTLFVGSYLLFKKHQEG